MGCQPQSHTNTGSDEAFFDTQLLLGVKVSCGKEKIGNEDGDSQAAGLVEEELTGLSPPSVQLH